MIGRTQILYAAAERLLADGFHIPLIITATEAPEYTRGRADFASLAERAGARFVFSDDVNGGEALRALADAEVDAGLSVNWPRLIRSEAIALTRHGIVNVHPGDLPNYKGNACPNWALLKGEPRLTVCCHWMDPDRLDAGNILAKRHMPATLDTRIGEFYAFWENSTPEMASELFTTMRQAGPPAGTAQTAEGFRCFPRRPEDGEVNWNSDGSTIVRLVNASSEPFAGAFTWAGDRRLTVWRARYEESNYLAVPGHVAARRNGEVAVTCGAGLVWLQSVSELGQERRPAAEIIRMSHTRLGRNGAIPS
ncbi:conserved hypothetical protein [Magnetospirillum sp. LM-5]|nr:conserved hypothetical protein [Magnetospirillum sp. LM-5]